MNGEITIMKIELQNELDVMLAQRRTMQLARFSNIGVSEQTRFSTAVSEICRNALEYTSGSFIQFAVKKNKSDCYLLAEIKDRGNGIKNIEEILARKPETYKGRGLGIVYARRLSDQFNIITDSEGTTVLIQKKIPDESKIFDKSIIDAWLKNLKDEPEISAYEELKARNTQLIEFTEQLQENASMLQKQMAEISLLNDKLSKANKRMNEFTFAVSHDLKNPLTSIKIATEYLSDSLQDETSVKYHGILSRSVKRFERTINSLVEILNIQNQEKQISKDLDFKETFLLIKEEYQEILKEAKAKIKTDFSGAPHITYIEGYLQSLLHNLISNSLKYRDPSRNLQIVIKTTPSANGVILTFTDNGVGMDLNMVKNKLFLPFSRFSDKPEGKGIGLYLIKSMVESNGGSISVNSQPGEGTTFTFELIPYI
ncbi:MAG TPA: sensor histidine kinase [Chitinophagaceae bacterium]|nr:sensor histidine kinase [Chitinophagaceae bacterium]